MEKEILTSHYLQMAPIDILMKDCKSMPHWPKIKAQKEFMSILELYKKYPPSSIWLRELLKRIERDVSNNCDEGLIDSIMEKLFSLQVNNDEESSDQAYITFLSFGCTSSFRVLRFHNQVGTRVWGLVNTSVLIVIVLSFYKQYDYTYLLRLLFLRKNVIIVLCFLACFFSINFMISPILF